MMVFFIRLFGSWRMVKVVILTLEVFLEYLIGVALFKIDLLVYMNKGTIRGRKEIQHLTLNI